MPLTLTLMQCALLLTFELDDPASDLGLDDDNYSSSESEEYGPGTPAFELANPFDEDDRYNVSFQKTSWKSLVLGPISDDMNQAIPWSGQEEEEYHYQYLAPPPACRLHPLLESSSAFDDRFDAVCFSGG